MMRWMTLVFFLLPAISTCRDHKSLRYPVKNNHPFSSIGEIPVPGGFHRIPADSGSFCGWLRTIRLKKNTTIYLYNGEPKKWQGAQFAVIDLPVGKKDLQQCADAIMRLRAEYYFKKRFDDSIIFHSGTTAISFARWMEGTRYRLIGDHLEGYFNNSIPWDRDREFQVYLETVFMYCGTYSLAGELKHRKSPTEVIPGDVFIKPGSPGHAMIVVDVAENSNREKIFMLAQSFMPAQDIHIVKNPGDYDLSPWYKIDGSSNIVTPEWSFRPDQLKG
jgi:hypothetical protein